MNKPILLSITLTSIAVLIVFLIPLLIIKASDSICDNRGIIVNSNLTTMDSPNRTLDCSSYHMLNGKWCEICT